MKLKKVQSPSINKGIDSPSKYVQSKKTLHKKIKYETNLSFRLKVLELHNKSYQVSLQKIKDMRKRIYWNNVLHMEKVKAKSIQKYRQNLLHINKVKGYSIQKYRNNLLYRDKVKSYNVHKYGNNLLHRDKVKARSQNKYHTNLEHKTRVIAANKVKRQRIKREAENFDNVMENFAAKVKSGPDFICCVCYRLLFQYQVLQCKKELYKKTKSIASLAEKCISEQFLHKCTNSCVIPCQWLNTSRGQLWICHSCH